MHRVHVEERAGHHRPPDRPQGQRPQPQGHPRPGRDVPRLALPRRVHRLPVRDASGRSPAPRPRPGGTGARGLDRRPTGSPASSFPANAAWLALAAISHNLLRAAGSLASLACAKARGATLRHDLIDVAARTARPAAGTSPCTCPKAGTASRNGPASSKPPPARPPQRPDPPRPGHRAPSAQAAPRQPASPPTTSGQAAQR
jgi:hypothetical protein